MTWFRSIVAAALCTLIAAWVTGFLDHHVPTPARAWLALENAWQNKPQHSEDGFRIVLCWLEDDSSGDDTKFVEQAFANVDGITLLRSARIVAASGAGDEWRTTMRENARKALEDWNADLAIVGLVKRTGEVLSLWFVPREGADTLDAGTSLTYW